MVAKPELLDRLVDVRDILESYRCCHIIPIDWYQKLSSAAAIIGDLDASEELGVRAGLAELLQLVLLHGFEDAPMAVSTAADEVERALQRNRVPGLPAPDDDHWEFGDGSTAS